MQTRKGTVRTPAFAPVGTRAALKGVLTSDLPDDGFDILLANTYHLMLRPGPDVVHDLGGVHKMMAWDRTILTDSGGFQVFSLAHRCKIHDDGVTFANHIDGAPTTLTPENVVQAQQDFGSDIAMVLDVCPPLPCPPRQLRDAVETTTRWAAQALDARTDPTMALFAIVQGGTDPEMRKHSASQLVQMPFDGFAIGGLSVGESPNDMYDTLDHTTPELPEQKIRYLMGVGRPDNIVEAVARGVDLFDCVMPTRNARNGKLMTWDGFVNIQRQEFARDDRPLDSGCACPTCTTVSRGTLRHLAKTGEFNFARLATVHNLHFMAELMSKVRDTIADGSFDELRQHVVACYA